MGTRTFRRIEDFFRHQVDMKVRCSNCGHDGVIDPYRLYRWYSLHRWDVTIEAVPAHMRCEVCKRRPTEIIPIERVTARASDAFFPADDAGWRALQRRLRG